MRYSALKAMKFPDRLEALRGGAPAGPVHVQLILSDLCNQACNFCAYRDPDYSSSQLFHVEQNYNPNRKLPFEKVIEILDDCAEMGVKAVQLTGGGEPTVHPRFGEVVRAIVERGMAWALVTNGVIGKWDCSNAAWVRVSLDAASPETYAKIRNVPRWHFDRACQTIAKLRCGVGFVVTPENWREIYLAARLARDLGASNIRIGAQFSAKGEDLFDGFRNVALALAKDAVEKLSTPSFEVINKFSEKLNDLEQGRPDYHRCGYQQFTTYIGGDQNLYRCCVQAYNEQGKIGNLASMRFRDAWEAAARRFKDFDATNCVRCQFNEINRRINEVVTRDASEVFV